MTGQVADLGSRRDDRLIREVIKGAAEKSDQVAGPLTGREASELADCERVIDGGIRAFVAVGNALARIRDAKLYRGTYQTFDDYASARWGLSRTRAYELAAAAEVVGRLSAIADGVVLPANEAQARELAPLRHDAVAMVEVWRTAVEMAAAGGQLVTAELVRGIRLDMKERRDRALRDALRAKLAESAAPEPGQRSGRATPAARPALTLVEDPEPESAAGDLAEESGAPDAPASNGEHALALAAELAGLDPAAVVAALPDGEALGLADTLAAVARRIRAAQRQADAGPVLAALASRPEGLTLADCKRLVTGLPGNRGEAALGAARKAGRISEAIEERPDKNARPARQTVLRLLKDRKSDEPNHGGARARPDRRA